MSDVNPFFDAFSNTDDDTVDAETNEVSPQETSQVESVAAPVVNQFQGFSDSPFNNSSPKKFNNEQSTSKKYYTKDLYWFVNLKLYKKQQLDQGEAACVTISFNSQYDNMRIVLLQPNSDAFADNAMIRNNCKVITTVNVYSETCEALKYYYERSLNEKTPIQWNPFERLIEANSKWKPNKSKFELDKKNNRITIYTSPSNGANQVYKFTFEEFQTIGLLNAFEFLRGGAWNVSNLSQFLI